MRRFVEPTIIVIITLSFAIANQLHVISEWVTNAPDRLFTGIAHYYADYFLYTDLMAQGTAGNLWTAAHFTNEPMAKTWIYWFNALLGGFGNLVGLSPFATYNVSLFLLVIALCLLWYKLTKILYPTNRSLRLTSWIMILTASSFWWNGELLGLFWFSPTPALNRLGGVPHQVFQTVLFLLLAISFTRFLTMKSSPLSYSFIHNSVFLFLLTILASSTNPIQMILFVGAATVTTAYAPNHRNIFNVSIRQSMFVLGIVTVTGAFGAWVTNRAFELPVLAAAKAWENAQVISVSLWQFFLSMGPIAFFVPFGVKPFLRYHTLDPRVRGYDTITQQNALRFLLFSYGALSILVFFSTVPKLLGTTSVRWLSPAAYGALGILAAEGVMAILKFSKKSLLVIGYWILVIGYLLLTIPSLASQINGRANPKYNTILTSNLNHVPKPVVTALTWLKVTGRGPVMERPVVLTDPTLPYDVLVPTFTGLPSFTGHPLHTLYPQVKEKLRRDFFSGVMSIDQQRQFLADHRIGYIITATNREFLWSTSPLIKQIYKNTEISIYRSSNK